MESDSGGYKNLIGLPHVTILTLIQYNQLMCGKYKVCVPPFLCHEGLLLVSDIKFLAQIMDDSERGF